MPANILDRRVDVAERRQLQYRHDSQQMPQMLLQMFKNPLIEEQSGKDDAAGSRA